MTKRKKAKDSVEAQFMIHEMGKIAYTLGNTLTMPVYRLGIVNELSRVASRLRIAQHIDDDISDRETKMTEILQFSIWSLAQIIGCRITKDITQEERDANIKTD